MPKKNKSPAAIDWYTFWTKQCKSFLLVAEKDLHKFFTSTDCLDPEKHLDQIYAWLETLKKQLDLAQSKEENEDFQFYWEIMAPLYQQASDLLIKEWIKRGRVKNPLRYVHELYGLWLDCCTITYQKSLQSKTYQETYSELMNAALNFLK